MQDITKTIVDLYFNMNRPNEVLLVDIKDVAKVADVSDKDVTMKLDYMEDDMYMVVYKVTNHKFKLQLTSRGVDYFKQIFKNKK